MARASYLETPYSRLNSRQQRFVDLLVMRGMGAADAAREAGYSGNHFMVGQEMKKRDNIKAAIQERLQSLHDKVEMDPTEVLQRLTAVGRDAHHKDHVKALETLAKIHGLTQDTLNIKMDKPNLLRAVDAEIERLKQGTAIVDIEAKLLTTKPEIPEKLTPRKIRRKKEFAKLLLKQGKKLPPSLQDYAPTPEEIGAQDMKVEE
jgi:hypothetical protein